MRTESQYEEKCREARDNIQESFIREVSAESIRNLSMAEKEYLISIGADEKMAAAAGFAITFKYISDLANFTFMKILRNKKIPGNRAVEREVVRRINKRFVR